MNEAGSNQSTSSNEQGQPVSISEPIPALPYHVSVEDGWRGLVRLMLLCGIIIGSFNILMPLLIFTGTLDGWALESRRYENGVTFVSAAAQFALGIAQVDASWRGRLFQSGSNHYVIRVLWSTLLVITLFTMWTVVAVGLRIDEYTAHSLSYLGYSLGYYAEYYFYGYLPPIVGLYVFRRPEVRQLYPGRGE